MIPTHDIQRDEFNEDLKKDREFEENYRADDLTPDENDRKENTVSPEDFPVDPAEANLCISCQ